MKKIIFLLMLGFALVLSSCTKKESTNDPTNNSTNNTVVNDEEVVYQVSSVQFEKANNFEGIKYLKATFSEWVDNNGVKSNEDTQTIICESREQVESNETINTLFDLVDKRFSAYDYDEATQSYHDVFTINVMGINQVDTTLKYENGKLVYFLSKMTYISGDIECVEAVFEY